MGRKVHYVIFPDGKPEEAIKASSWIAAKFIEVSMGVGLLLRWEPRRVNSFRGPEPMEAGEIQAAIDHFDEAVRARQGARKARA